jgi:hypothetical protein
MICIEVEKIVKIRLFFIPFVFFSSQEVPALISGLESLTLLDLRTNPKLTKLPPELAK